MYVYIYIYRCVRALKRDMTRFGRRTHRGIWEDGMNSLTRYYVNNWCDRDTQQGIDIMLTGSDLDIDVAVGIDGNGNGESEH